MRRPKEEDKIYMHAGTDRMSSNMLPIAVVPPAQRLQLCTQDVDEFMSPGYVVDQALFLRT